MAIIIIDGKKFRTGTPYISSSLHKIEYENRHTTQTIVYELVKKDPVFATMAVDRLNVTAKFAI